MENWDKHIQDNQKEINRLEQELVACRKVELQIKDEIENLQLENAAITKFKE